MADTKFNAVQVLVQGGAVSNVAPPPSSGSPVTVTDQGTTAGADHLVFPSTASLALDRGAPDDMGSCIEMVLEQTWSPDGQLLECLGRGYPQQAAGRISIYADPDVENGYVYQWELSANIVKFTLPAAPARSLLRIQSRMVNFALKRTIDVVPEVGLPTYIDGVNYGMFDRDNQRLYPATLGATVGSRVTVPDTEAYARALNVVLPNRVGQENAISRIAVDWVLFPFQVGLAKPTTNTPLAEITLNIGLLFGAVTASVTRYNTTADTVVAELIGKFTAALNDAGYIASYSSDGWMYSISVAPPPNAGYWDFNFGIGGSWTYADLTLNRSTPWVYSIGSAVTQRGYSSVGPNAFQRSRYSVFIADQDKQYEVTAVRDTVTATELVGGGESVSIGLARLSGKLGLNGSWSQPSAGTFVIDHEFPDYTLHVAIASITRVRSLPSAISKLYSLRITSAERTETAFPELPWPTTSIGGSSGGSSSNVVLLLHGDGANGSTTFTDSSTYGHTVTAGGGEASISTTQSKFGGASIHIPHVAVVSDLIVGPHAALAMGTGDFTAEAWVYVDVGVSILPSESSLFGDFLWSGGYQGGWVVEVIADGSVMLRYDGSLYGYSTLSTEPGLVAGNTWHHIATSRSDGTQRIFVDGVLRATVANTKDYTPGRPFVIGSRHSDGSSITLLNGYIDDLRVTKGAALYTGNFTPPTAALSTTLPGAPTDVNGAQYVDLANFTSVGTGAQQATAPDAYGTSSVTLAGVTVAHSVTVNNNGVSGTGTSDVLAGMTCSGAGVAAMPTNLTGDCTLDSLVGTASGVASIPIEVTVTATLESTSQSAFALVLAPSVATGSAALDDHSVSEFAVSMTTPPTAQIAAVMPAPTVSSTGSVKDDTITAQMPTATSMSWGHAVLTTRLPSVSASASGTVTNVGDLNAVMPAPLVVVTGRVSGSSAMFVSCPSLRAAASGAGELHAALTGFTALVSGVVGATAQIAALMPMATVIASVSRVNTGQIIAVMPMLVPFTGGTAHLTMPMVRVTITGNAAVATGFEAYALNLGVSPDVNLRRKNEMSNAQLTRYTNYPFTQIVRFRGAYYGVAADGLYRLGGLTDAGAPITWAVDLCTTDFDTPLKKTMVSVYLGGSAGPNVDFTVRGGETADMMHAYTTSATAVQRNHRQRFGLGRKTRYYSLGLSGQGALDLDSLDFEVVNTTRRI